MSKNAAKRERDAQIAATMRTLKGRFGPEVELHHVFGRTGRMAACPHFVRPLTPDQHRGRESWRPIEELRNKMRSEWLLMQLENRQNADLTTCWDYTCPSREGCPLWEKALQQDREVLRRKGFDEDL